MTEKNELIEVPLSHSLLLLEKCNYSCCCIAFFLYILFTFFRETFEGMCSQLFIRVENCLKQLLENSGLWVTTLNARSVSVTQAIVGVEIDIS